MDFTLNGKPAHWDGGSRKTLLRYLRDDAGITSVKDGCSGQAFCGACLVELNGKPVLSCATDMARAAGASVRTLDGFPENVKAAAAEVFVKRGAVQCGFCTPGILTRVLIFLRDNPSPTREEIVKALSGHFCRCTGYKKIFDAVEETAGLISGSGEAVSAGTSAGEAKFLKYNARERAVGRAPFTDDLAFPGMLHAVPLFSAHPRAVVEKIDTGGAEDCEGVVRIFTAPDIPGERMTGLIKKDWPMMIAEGETTRCLGDVLALAVAETREAAEKARDMIAVTYGVLEPVTDPFTALTNKIMLHPGGNLLEETRIRRGGDVDEYFSWSDYVVKGTYTTQRIEHAFLECEAAVARPLSGGGVEVFVQSQGVYEDRAQLAVLLGLPEEKVAVNLVPAGGGFGGKEDLAVQHHAALCSFLLGRPVKIRLTREDSIRLHPKRHPMVMEYELGCSREGKLTALKACITGDTGAYASVGGKVLERAAGHATGAYHIPAAHIDARAVYTNNAPCGAMRGFGVNQVTFAIESCIDELCEKGGFDKWQFRYDNALTEGSVTATGQLLESGVGVRACLEALKPAYDTYDCTGLACGIKNCGIGNGMIDDCGVVIEIAAGGRVMLHHGWTEMGQGVDTVVRRIFCDETGVDPSLVDVKVSTVYEARAGMTTASRASVLAGNAMLDAAAKAEKDIREKGLAALAGREYRGYWKCDWTTKPGAPGPAVTHFGYGYAAQLVVLDNEGNIAKIIAAHDAGRVLNPVLFEGQVEGALLMGLGYALSENLPMEGGRFLSYKMKDLGLLRAGDVPPMEVIAVEVPDAVGPYGAKGVGEIGLVPTAAAYANAWYQFSGERLHHLPRKGGKR